jgi:hypothetical protein
VGGYEGGCGVTVTGAVYCFDGSPSGSFAQGVPAPGSP